MSYNESLNSNSNYPVMSQSEWDNAPFNQVEIPEKEFDIDVEFVLRKTVTVSTNDYMPEYDDEDGREYRNTANTDWECAYSESGHYTIQELLVKLKDYALKDLEKCSDDSPKSRTLKNIIESCDGWEVFDKSFEY